MKNNFDKRVEIIEELREMDKEFETDIGNVTSGRVSSLTHTFKIFNDNLSELFDWAKESNVPEFLLPINNPKNKDIANEYAVTFIRKLLNLLASASTFIDHTLTIKEELIKIKPEFDSIYKANAAEKLRDNPIARFVKDLRNYLLPYGLINYKITMDLITKKVLYLGLLLM